MLKGEEYGLNVCGWVRGGGLPCAGRVLEVIRLRGGFWNGMEDGVEFLEGSGDGDRLALGRWLLCLLLSAWLD